MSNTLKPSWGPPERASLKASWGVARKSIAREAQSSSDPILRIHDWDARQIDRLDRLYLNTAMSSAEYARYIKSHDAFVHKLLDKWGGKDTAFKHGKLMKPNPKRGKRLIPSAKSRKRAKAKRVLRPVRRVLKGAKLKPRRRHAVAKRKRESFIICAPHENRRTLYYWTGKNFDTDKSKAQKFPSLVAARTFARGILKRLPSVLTELEIKRG